jgi:hypothetical protein
MSQDQSLESPLHHPIAMSGVADNATTDYPLFSAPGHWYFQEELYVVLYNSQKMINNFVYFGVGDFGIHANYINSFVEANDIWDNAFEKDKDDIRNRIWKIRMAEIESNKIKGIKYMRFVWGHKYRHHFRDICYHIEYLFDKYLNISKDPVNAQNYELNYSTLYTFYNIFLIFHSKYPFFYDEFNLDKDIIKYSFYMKEFYDIRAIIKDPFPVPLILPKGIQTIPDYIWDEIDMDIIDQIDFCMKEILDTYYKEVLLPNIEKQVPDTEMEKKDKNSLLVLFDQRQPVYFNVKDDLKILYMCLYKIIINNFYYYVYTKENNIVKSMKDNRMRNLYNDNTFNAADTGNILSRERYKGNEHSIINFVRFGVFLHDDDVDVYNPDDDPLIKYNSEMVSKNSPFPNYLKDLNFENSIREKIKLKRIENAKGKNFKPFIWDYKFKMLFDKITGHNTDLLMRSTFLYKSRLTEKNRYYELHKLIQIFYDVCLMLLSKYPYYYNEEKKIKIFPYDQMFNNIKQIIFDIKDKKK